MSRNANHILPGDLRTKVIFYAVTRVHQGGGDYSAGMAIYRREWCKVEDPSESESLSSGSVGGDSRMTIIMPHSQALPIDRDMLAYIAGDYWHVASKPSLIEAKRWKYERVELTKASGVSLPTTTTTTSTTTSTTTTTTTAP